MKHQTPNRCQSASSQNSGLQSDALLCTPYSRNGDGKKHNFMGKSLNNKNDVKTTPQQQQKQQEQRRVAYKAMVQPKKVTSNYNLPIQQVRPATAATVERQQSNKKMHYANSNSQVKLSAQKHTMMS